MSQETHFWEDSQKLAAIMRVWGGNNRMTLHQRRSLLGRFSFAPQHL